jgi:enoyl-CoA hydratase
VDAGPEELVAAAVAFATPAAAAPRELVTATKRTLRATSALALHTDAVETELAAQLASMDTPAFNKLLAAMREKISKQR